MKWYEVFMAEKKATKVAPFPKHEIYFRIKV